MAARVRFESSRSCVSLENFTMKGRACCGRRSTMCSVSSVSSSASFLLCASPALSSTTLIRVSTNSPSRRERRREESALVMSGHRRWMPRATAAMSSSPLSNPLAPWSFFSRPRMLPESVLQMRKKEMVMRAMVDATDADFDFEVLQADLPVLVDFWAEWCGPCKLVAPSMAWAEKEFDGQLKVVKIDCTDTNKSLMERYKVYGLPCLIIFKNGSKVEESHHEGAITRKDLAKYLEKHVGLKTPAA